MRAVTGSMGQVVRGMDKAMETMNLEKVSPGRGGRRENTNHGCPSAARILPGKREYTFYCSEIAGDGGKGSSQDSAVWRPR